MLPPFIIEQIRRREEDDKRRREADQPRLEITIEAPYAPVERPRAPEKDDIDRGVVILDLGLALLTRTPHPRPLSPEPPEGRASVSSRLSVGHANPHPRPLSPEGRGELSGVSMCTNTVGHFSLSSPLPPGERGRG